VGPGGGVLLAAGLRRGSAGKGSPLAALAAEGARAAAQLEASHRVPAREPPRPLRLRKSPCPLQPWAADSRDP